MKSCEEMEIDLVYMWVDGNDPEWRARHNAAVGKTDGGSSTDGNARYADNDELRYSLRSAALYAPWVRRIHILTDRQVPRWLDVSNPRIRIVDHSEVMPSEMLPIFNSSVIEHFLWRIPGLSEHFLFSNDDMFFNRPVRPSDFFTTSGMPIMRMNLRPFRKFDLWFREKIQKKTLSNYNRIVNNAARLVERDFGKFYGSKAHHNIDAYRISDLKHGFNHFLKDLKPTFTNRTRQENDIQRSLYSYLAMAEKTAKREFVTQRTSFRLHTHKHKHYDRLRKSNPMLFCLNDSEFASDQDRRLVREFLNSRFPEPSEFEL